MVGEMSVRRNVLVGKCPVGEVSFREVSGRRIARSGKCPLGKCPSAKCQLGICPRGSVSRGSVQSGNCPTIPISINQNIFPVSSKYMILLSAVQIFLKPTSYVILFRYSIPSAVTLSVIEISVFATFSY